MSSTHRHGTTIALITAGIVLILFAGMLTFTAPKENLYGGAVVIPSSKPFLTPLYSGILPTGGTYLTTDVTTLAQKNTTIQIFYGYLSNEIAPNLNTLYRYKYTGKNEYTYSTTKLQGYEEETILGYIAQTLQQVPTPGIALSMTLQGAKRTLYYPGSPAAKKILGITQDSTSKETILGYLASDDPTKITSPYTPTYSNHALNYVTSEGYRGKTSNTYKFPIISTRSDKTLLNITLQAGPVPHYNQDIINAYETHWGVNQQAIDQAIQGKITDWHIIRMWGFEPAAQGVHWTMKPSEQPEGFVNLNTPNSGRRIYHAGMSTSDTLNYTLLIKYGPEASSQVPQGLLGYIIIEAGSLVSSEVTGTISLQEQYKNTTLQDYDTTKGSPAPTLTILRGEGVNLGRISKTPRPVPIDVPFIKAESKEQKPPLYSSTITPTSTTLGYLSTTKNCAFIVLNTARCDGRTIQRMVYNITCQYEWLDEATCTTGQYCFNSTCLGAQHCTETDAGLSYTTKGNATGPLSNEKKYVASTFTDTCLNTTMLAEYSCTSEGILIQTNVPCACTAGACIPQQCTDTDEGLTFFKKGNTTGPVTNTTRHAAITYNDTCSSNNTLTEYSCTPEGLVAQTNITCACNAGICEQQQCIDSDLGNTSVRGTITGPAAPNSTQLLTLTDACAVEGTTLSEYTCEAGIIKNVSVACNCRNGACQTCTPQETKRWCDDGKLLRETKSSDCRLTTETIKQCQKGCDTLNNICNEDIICTNIPTEQSIVCGSDNTSYADACSAKKNGILDSRAGRCCTTDNDCSIGTICIETLCVPGARILPPAQEPVKEAPAKTTPLLPFILSLLALAGILAIIALLINKNKKDKTPPGKNKKRSWKKHLPIYGKKGPLKEYNLKRRRYIPHPL